MLLFYMRVGEEPRLYCSSTTLDKRWVFGFVVSFLKGAKARSSDSSHRKQSDNFTLPKFKLFVSEPQQWNYAYGFHIYAYASPRPYFLDNTWTEDIELASKGEKQRESVGDSLLSV